MNEQQVTIIYHISSMSVPSQHCLFSAASTASAGGLQQLLINAEAKAASLDVINGLTSLQLHFHACLSCLGHVSHSFWFTGKIVGLFTL